MLAARTEAAWLEGSGFEPTLEVVNGLELAVRKRHAWFASELLYWRSTIEPGASQPLPEFIAGNPFALEAAGQWRAAATAWRALDCPYETARALSAGDETAQREALGTFEALGARPMIERVRHQLRAAGVRGLPRGPRESTRQRPAGLTSREVAVLTLLAAGLRNKEIAARLHRSPRTIDHHVAAIFAKLGAANRAEAVSEAHRLGILGSSMPVRPDLRLP
jgi:DNA-binding CsgD family transcriptional regulator